MKAVIIGVAHWHAPIYAHVLTELGVPVLGASDLDASAGESAARHLGLAFAPQSATLLDRAHPDIAFVLPRHDRVLDELRPVLNRRLPFLIEKPMGRTGAEARAIARAASGTGVFAASALANRELQIWTRLAALRETGQLGTVIHAHFRLVNGPPCRYTDWGVPWMLDPAISGGGALRNLGFHSVDAALSLAAGSAVTVRGAAVGNTAYGLAVEEFATALLHVPGGPAISVEAGYSYPAEGGDLEWRIAATGAYLRQTRDRLEVRLADGATESTATPPPAYFPFVEETLRRLRASEKPRATVEDCAAAAELIDRIYAAARNAEGTP